MVDIIDPTSQSDFTEQVVNNVTEIEPGHQCYKIDPIPSTVAAGSNATIQLEYWASYEGENDGKNETFYACADVVSFSVLLFPFLFSLYPLSFSFLLPEQPILYIPTSPAVLRNL